MFCVWCVVGASVGGNDGQVFPDVERDARFCQSHVSGSLHGHGHGGIWIS